jgi:hypothetical protein
VKSQKKNLLAIRCPTTSDIPDHPTRHLCPINPNTMSATEQKQKLGGHTQLFGEQLVTIKDLDNFKNDLLIEVKKTLKETNGQPTKRWLKTNEVRKILGISITTLLTLRINGILPYSKIGGVLYFDYDDILKVMEEKKVKHPYSAR